MPKPPSIIAPAVDGENNYITKISPLSNAPIVTKALNNLTQAGRSTFDLLTNPLRNIPGIEQVFGGKFPQDPANSASKSGNATISEFGASASIDPADRLDDSTGSISVKADFPDAVESEMIQAIEPPSNVIGGQDWKIRVVLFNHEQIPYELRPEAIKQLVLEEDLLMWPHKGQMILNNAMEGLERSHELQGSYHFRSDCRDEVLVQIEPSDAFKSIIRRVFGEFDQEIWTYYLHGIIYDVEDLPSANTYEKLKRIYFWDKNFQTLYETNVDWSTARGTRFKSEIPPSPIAHATDDERSMFTGEAIASLLTELNVPFDEEQWDWGTGKINYTNKANWTAWENLDYLLQCHSSEDTSDNCVLKWDRFNQKLTFQPFKKYFEQAGKDANNPGPLQWEHWFFEELADEETTTPFKAPFKEEPDQRIDTKAEEWGKITNYRFSQMAGLDNAKALLSKPVYSHWHRRKQFNCDHAQNDVATTEKYFLDNYVSQLMGRNFPIFKLNMTKKEQRSIKNQICRGTTEDPICNCSVGGRNKSLFQAIMLNNNLSLTIRGMISRQVGSFVGVDRILQQSDTQYDYDLNGQYLVISLKHIFQFRKYINEVTLVKIHAFDYLLEENEDIV
jgi:hypothetical protein